MSLPAAPGRNRFSRFLLRTLLPALSAVGMLAHAPAAHAQFSKMRVSRDKARNST